MKQIRTYIDDSVDQIKSVHRERFGGRDERGAAAALIYRRRGHMLYLSRKPAAHCVFFMSHLARRSQLDCQSLRRRHHTRC